MNLLVTLIVGLLGAGGIAGAIVALLKVRPEAGQIVVDAAKGAVVIQSGVLEELRQERVADREEHKQELVAQEERHRQAMTRMGKRLDDALGELAHLREEVSRCEALREELAQTKEQRDAAIREAQGLKERVATLETEVKTLQANLNGGGS